MDSCVLVSSTWKVNAYYLSVSVHVGVALTEVLQCSPLFLWENCPLTQRMTSNKNITFILLSLLSSLPKLMMRLQSACGTGGNDAQQRSDAFQVETDCSPCQGCTSLHHEPGWKMLSLDLDGFCEFLCFDWFLPPNMIQCWCKEEGHTYCFTSSKCFLNTSISIFHPLCHLYF